MSNINIRGPPSKFFSFLWTILPASIEVTRYVFGEVFKNHWFTKTKILRVKPRILL